MCPTAFWCYGTTSTTSHLNTDRTPIWLLLRQGYWCYRNLVDCLMCASASASGLSPCGRLGVRLPPRLAGCAVQYTHGVHGGIENFPATIWQYTPWRHLECYKSVSWPALNKTEMMMSLFWPFQSTFSRDTYINLWAHCQYHSVKGGCFPDQGRMHTHTTHGGESPVVHMVYVRIWAFQTRRIATWRDWDAEADADANTQTHTAPHNFPGGKFLDADAHMET